MRELGYWEVFACISFGEMPMLGWDRGEGSVWLLYLFYMFYVFCFFFLFALLVKLAVRSIRLSLTLIFLFFSLVLNDPTQIDPTS